MVSGDDKKMPEVEIEALRIRMDGLEKQNEKQFIKIENSLDKVWAKIDEQKTGQTITHTLVEGLSKSFIDSRIENAKVLDKIVDKVDGLKNDMASSEVQRLKSENISNEKHVGEWKRYWSKIAIGAVAVIIGIFLYKLGLSSK